MGLRAMSNGNILTKERWHMAVPAQRRQRRYDTYGNVAYQPQQASEPIRSGVQRAGQEVQPVRRPRVQPRTRTIVRPQVAVRPQGAVAPFAILGLLAVAVCALLVVMTSAQLAMVNDETVDLRATLSDLEAEERTLQTQYELAFDLAAIEEQLTADGSMVQASPSQTVYLDLSEGDQVVYYEAAQEGLTGLIRRAEELLSGLLS